MRSSENTADPLVDVVVIGGGAAGLNGALMLARSRRSVVVVDNGTPRNAPAEGVHGLLGLDGTPPAELLRRGREEVTRYGGRIVSGEVTSATPGAPSADGDLRFAITLADGSTLRARRVLVATGLRDVLPTSPDWPRTGATAWCTAPTATAGRCATNPSASWPWARPRSTTRCCSAS